MTETELNCPLCQQLNSCAVNSAEPCWCMAKKIPEGLIRQVPSEKKNKSCICASCVEKFNQLAKSVN
ncbi:cysteine-rich CWC family protein [Pseudocolwellia sp. HL-MZ19]|uniref:cysteine-rich CWC family protein n=1 Tax=unclassified Pseudocolwellia TaxID=2848178 RepID=UPI003CF36A50